MKNLVLAFALLFSSTACFADEARGRGKPEIQHKEREHHRPEMHRGHQYHGQHHRGYQHWRAPQHRPPVGFRPTIGWLLLVLDFMVRQEFTRLIIMVDIDEFYIKDKQIIGRKNRVGNLY